MPVWKPAAAAVASIAQRAGGGEEVWPVIFSELAPVSRGEYSSSEVAVPSWPNSVQEENVQDGKWQEEKTWRNPGYMESRRLLQMRGLPSGVRQLVDVSGPLNAFPDADKFLGTIVEGASGHRKLRNSTHPNTRIMSISR
jgi:hypothetical protein